MAVKADVSDLLDFANDADRASVEAAGLMLDAAQTLGHAIEGRAKFNAARRHNKRSTGTMANSVAMVPKSVTATAAVVEIVAPAVSLQGFPYPIVMDQGRGPIVMPPGRYMRFEGDTGTVFLRRLPAYEGSRWFSDAETDTEKSGDVEAVIGLFADDVFAILRG